MPARLVKAVVYTGLIGLCLPLSVLAFESQPPVLRKHGDWWFGMDAGFGRLDRELAPIDATISDTEFFLGARVEYVINPNILLGVEANGWLIQPGVIEYSGGTPPLKFEEQIEGEGIAPVLITARYYPKDTASWYLKAGAGYVSHWKSHLGVTDRDSGTGFMLGSGYDYDINESWDITAMISYSAGSTGDEDYDAVTLTIGFNYKLRRR